MPISDEELKKIVLDSKLVDEKEIANLTELAAQKKVPLWAILIDKDLVSDENLGILIADFLKTPFVSLAKVSIPLEILYQIPEVIAQKQKMIAFAKDKNGLKVAIANPLNKEPVMFLAKKTGESISVFFATDKDIDQAMILYKKDLQKSFDELLKEKFNDVTKLVDLLVEYAYSNRASDIHIEPEKDRSFVRFRIDGVLHDVLDFPKELHEQVVQRVKVAAKLKSDEHMSAQDGKMQVVMPEEELDIRVSIVPTTRGEKVVMRLLSSKTRQFALADLGMQPRDLDRTRAAMDKPYGMILSTGPTGSGKTTTIYAVIKILNTRDINIATIEDPVEYEISGINQIQANPKSNLTFANGLKSILRQDPNVIFVGEIRDNETADIAVNAATTGHLVLSTLHTNDAATTLPRLLDMGIEPYLVASTVNLIIGQRLVRRICEKCRLSKVIGREELSKNISASVLQKQLGDETDLAAYQGKGCPVCHQTGYIGRVGIFECLQVSEEIKNMIIAKASSDAIRNKAVSLGMTTMLEDGISKVQQGITTIDEILRVTKE